MKKNDLHTFSLYILSLIILSKVCCGADHQYEACAPTNCSGGGPSISFPFFLPTVQESYCGYPGFAIRCRDGLPLLHLSEDEYIVEDIFYSNRSLHVFNAAALLSDEISSCAPIGIRNTTLPADRFDYVGGETFHLLFDCKNVSEELLRYEVGCNSSRETSNNETLAMYGGNGNLRRALERCEENVVARVELYGDEREDEIVDVAAVLRRGFLMNWTASDCSTCQESGGRCGFNETSFHFRCFCPDRPHSRSCKPKNRLTVILLASLIPGVAILVLLGGCIFWLRKKKMGGAYLLSRNLSYDPSSKSDIEDGSFNFGVPIFSYTELVDATGNFDPSKELGDGGFGTVYYGKLRDGREVAIKRLYEHNYRRVEQFLNEIKILTSLRHPNLVSLYGCTSRRSRELLLVYEYIPNGTVADHLHGERASEAPLTWGVRMSIARETATALAYLHKSDIIHRDVKTNNILLDSNFSVKVADFGLSRLFPIDVTHISTAPQGTPGYVDPEYHQCYQLTDKSDVYSFGVVLIELISSMPAVDISRHKHEINLASLAVNKIQRCAFDELIDPFTGYNSDAEATRMTTSVAELAFRCLQLDKDMRPSMEEVVAFLHDIHTGGDCDFDQVKGGARDLQGKIPPSPETDEVVLLKSRIYQSSPTAVTDTWISSDSTTASSVG
ncbi:LEAF RUST 10 DISEASE-RESISTANCE LOCUS RECEPTOR-LIKE PROTEIN KINASE-like 1.2 isoform X1 [Salvia miltiorrhiza]|uniref:LEAF RUST 10 DISEASE-RESISTANCE LOCUS RECEPTOR-LIKE PROTEIN KINASE-like 1.2 isoform X1 n=1 Tax=Salvia miltiorrhiza TaxID=226208 RepID=UPI0025ACEDCB|nr:LEAF RUST 10 DISEASE-RESISTANCE LOCUS RECEPTOR-LIKE PROTEIN KINASE-like 1.2 isoform X1 [Salvia miltiorrhiza]